MVRGIALALLGPARHTTTTCRRLTVTTQDKQDSPASNAGSIITVYSPSRERKGRCEGNGWFRRVRRFPAHVVHGYCAWTDGRLRENGRWLEAVHQGGRIQAGLRWGRVVSYGECLRGCTRCRPGPRDSQGARPEPGGLLTLESALSERGSRSRQRKERRCFQ